jgi:Alpha/beta hydrolase domain
VKAAAAALFVLLSAAGLGAEVVRVEVSSREPFAGGIAFGTVGAYEKVRGRLVFAVDPENAANARIVDLRLAPRDLRGRVGFSADFVLLKPVDLSKGNHRLLYDVNNRGNLGILARLNRGEGTNDPSTAAHAGNGFLMRQGYSILWSGWNWDVQPGNGRLQIDLPVATDRGKTITGRVVAEIVVDERTDVRPFAWGDSRCYEVVDATTNRGATLTVRDEQRASRVEIPRERWSFADPTHVRLEGGFEPGRIYELVYTGKDPRVVGLGLAAIRDAISFFHFSTRDAVGAPSPLSRTDSDGTTRPDPEKAIAFGISQSGRVVNHMVFQGLHVDEAGRMVFEAAMPHVAGAGKGSFNHRFAQTTRHPSPLEDHQYPADFFPSTTVPDTDPVSGKTGDVLAVAKQMGKVPLLMYTGTSTEYWTRAASPLHVSPDGMRDAGVDEHVRIYFIAGGQHGIAASRDRVYQNRPNPLDHSPPLRALLLALDRWATTGALPPPSLYPRIDRGELVTAASYAASFPRIPGARPPKSNLEPPRLDLGPRFESEGIVDTQPPAFGPGFATRVPAPDADGNDRGGIRLPDVAVPLGAYTGWNLRPAAMGAEGALARWSGSFFPFAAAAEDRSRSNDPRLSIAERYGGHDDYVGRVAAAAEGLVNQGYLLDEDARTLVETARNLSWPPPLQ